MIIIRTLVCPFGLCNISNCFSSTSSSTHSHYLFKWNPNRSKEKELQVDIWNIYFWTKFWILVHCAPRGWLFFAMSDWLSQFRSGSLAAFVYSLPKIKWVLEFEPKNLDNVHLLRMICSEWFYRFSCSIFPIDFTVCWSNWVKILRVLEFESRSQMSN